MNEEKELLKYIAARQNPDVTVRDKFEELKPVVPQYVADFYESIKNDFGFEYKLYKLCILYKDNSDELSDEIWSWFDDCYNESLQTLVKMKLFGYEIEK